LAKTGIGITVIRKEARDKVTGQAKYTNDFLTVGMLTANIVTSACAHARIRSVDTAAASALPGVRAVLTGDSGSVLYGPTIEDRPPLAKGVVRYHGEPVALVVAEDEFTAAQAVALIQVDYEPLPVISSASQALQPGALLLHKEMGSYKLAVEDVYPEPGSNVLHREKIRKGDIDKGFSLCEVIVEARFNLPQSDHIAMETRAVQASISADGTVNIKSASQSPYEIKKELSKMFDILEGQVVVEVPLVGGGFGGKANVSLEALAYMATKAVNGAPVRIVNSRENDMISSPCKLGLEAAFKLGATKDGLLKAAQMTFSIDCGAYSDIGPRLAKAIAADCTGPYNIEHVWCDCICAYTNHPYSTSFRGFGHTSLTFCMERMMDKLARKLRLEPALLRERNCLLPGNTTPTMVKLTPSNLGYLPACVQRLKELINWGEGDRLDIGGNKIRAKGMACIWKTSNSPPDATSGAFITFNSDGSVNLNCGFVECGPAMKTTAAQLLSEKLGMDIKKIHVNMDVNTKYSPEHWKTVASMTTYLSGHAILRAAEDAVKQLKALAAIVLKVPPENLEVDNEMVYLKSDPSVFLPFRDLVLGYQLENGNSLEGQILGRGSFIMGDLNILDRETGTGRTGPYWTVGAQAVEIEFDTKEFTYRLVRAATVLDAGKVINPAMADALVKGGMCMGLGLASREHFQFDVSGKVLDTSLRTYKVMHFGQTPEYLVAFTETPNLDAPYGARGIAEHGIIGMPAALANALSVAAGAELDGLPLIPETIWRAKASAKLQTGQRQEPEGIYDPV
jgi:CO/xanthine dehydrogenase Mo-binding subunit